MTKEEYERFKKEYLKIFRNRYKNYKASRKELKRSVFENPSLTEQQKNEFWTLVTKKDLSKYKEIIGEKNERNKI